ncbi:MAG TPA: hypothetical protein VFG03_13665, partial [Telluria sp.]|nr:hypothetical protein [Telluria sp.]
MKLLKIGPASAIVALVFGTAAFAGAPDGPFGSNSHPAADFIWSYDGTRDNLTVNLQHLLGGEKNPFGPLEGGPEGVVPEGSELLADYVPHILGIPGPEIRLPNDQYFYSGAEPHNATR